MKSSILKKLETLCKRCQEVESMLSEASVVLNQDLFCTLSREYLKLSNINSCFINWKKIQNEIEVTKELLKDSEVSNLAEEELKSSYEKQRLLEKNLKVLLLPTDPIDEKSCFIEIRAATGGDEAALFASDLFRMYSRYAEIRNWKIKIINISENEKGGFKEVIAKITGKGVCGRLKFESGGHRVQRVPQTESQGRIHTSTCTVAIMPDIEKSEQININLNDLKIDTFRSSGAGGQHVNTTDSAIRITHIPTKTVVECQDERSQHKNKAKAMSILSARIYSSEQAKIHEKNASIRRNLLGSGDRSDRNRTYNFPQNRVTDHRINLSIYCLDEVLQGNIDVLIEPILQEYQADLLASIAN